MMSTRLLLPAIFLGVAATSAMQQSIWTKKDLVDAAMLLQGYGETGTLNLQTVRQLAGTLAAIKQVYPRVEQFHVTPGWYLSSLRVTQKPNKDIKKLNNYYDASLDLVDKNTWLITFRRWMDIPALQRVYAHAQDAVTINPILTAKKSANRGNIKLLKNEDDSTYRLIFIDRTHQDDTQAWSIGYDIEHNTTSGTLVQHTGSIEQKNPFEHAPVVYKNSYDEITRRRAKK